MHTRRAFGRLTGFALLAMFATTSVAAAQQDGVVEVASRGQKVRALLLKPADKPLGAVILLMGGNGRLDIAADGTLGAGRGNQLVRTRAGYAKAGFITLVPDVAPDLKTGDSVTAGSRFSQEQADDIAAVIAYARTLAGPVHLVGTSRAALPVTKVATTKLKGNGRPDSVVITAGMLMDMGAKQPSAQKNVGNLGRITQPVYLLHHAKDACDYTPASAVPRFKALLTGTSNVTIKIIDGGQPMPAGENPCQAQSPHGFLGQDNEVVGLVTGWLKGLKP